jgi:hypothetical protein
MNMPCGNTAALKQFEWEQDQLVEDSSAFEIEEAYWIRCVNDLLAGKTLLANFRKYNLAERLADEYQEFSDFVDEDFDYMAAFQNGSLDKKYADVVRQEAKIYASIIVG